VTPACTERSRSFAADSIVWLVNSTKPAMTAVDMMALNVPCTDWAVACRLKRLDFAESNAAFVLSSAVRTILASPPVLTGHLLLRAAAAHVRSATRSMIWISARTLRKSFGRTRCRPWRSSESTPA
jgi:hypothetical protein